MYWDYRHLFVPVAVFAVAFFIYSFESAGRQVGVSSSGPGVAR